MDLDTARTIDAGRRRTRHHDEGVVASQLDAVPPSRRMAGEYGLGREHECRSLTSDPVVDSDAGDHVHPMQDAPKLRTEQPSSADESRRDGISATEGLRPQ